MTTSVDTYFKIYWELCGNTNLYTIYSHETRGELYSTTHQYAPD